MSKLDIKYISIEIHDIIRMIFKQLSFNKHFYFFDKIDNNKFENIYRNFINLLLELVNGEQMKLFDKGFHFKLNKRTVYISYKFIHIDIYKFDICIS